MRKLVEDTKPKVYKNRTSRFKIQESSVETSQKNGGADGGYDTNKDVHSLEVDHAPIKANDIHVEHKDHKPWKAYGEKVKHGRCACLDHKKNIQRLDALTFYLYILITFATILICAIPLFAKKNEGEALRMDLFVDY